jgi:hypothetical protein
MIEMSRDDIYYAEENAHVSTVMMSLALDGYLDAEEQHGFQHHLQQCQYCRDRWLLWRQLGDMLQVEPLLGPAPGFPARVSQRIAGHDRRRERLLGSLVLVGGTLLIWSLVVLGAALTSSVWLVANPGAQIQALEFLGYVGQFVAVIVGNLTSLRDSVLGGGPALVGLALVSLALLAMAWLWVKLVSPGWTAAMGVNGAVSEFSRKQE